MIHFATYDTEQSREYLELLGIMGSLSRLFSDSEIPFIYYRFAENIFCKCFKAENLSRSDTAFDARINELGIGLKTFTVNGNGSIEKVAEFNALASELQCLESKDLAFKLAELRNGRIGLAKRVYGIKDSLYHIVARTKGKLLLFEADYDEIDLSNLQAISPTRSGLKFSDGKNEYSFNRSKSTLFRKFELPANAYEKEIKIVDDVYSLIARLSAEKLNPSLSKIAGIDYVVLPLYSTKGSKKLISEKSSLNMWNAGGRKRDIGEMYIQYPALVRAINSSFFPPRDEEFFLKAPSGEVWRAKICQDNSKALMTNPNKAISDWLLRRILGLKEGELATYKKLELLGFDSVIVSKETNHYSIDIMPLGSYEAFLQMHIASLKEGLKS
ncbi:MAG: restriction endonuclease [Wolinella sp.]